MDGTVWRVGLATLLCLSVAVMGTPPQTAQTARMAESLGQPEKIPHDPAFLGIRMAVRRMQEFSAPFQRREFQSLDGTPLVGAMAIHQDGKPRPGVVLSHGWEGNKNQKHIVEVSTLLYQNGWHVLAIDHRGCGESGTLSQAPITFGWREADDILAGAKFLRDQSTATSVAVLGFSVGGRNAVKAMVKDQGQLLQAGMTFGAPIGAPPPLVSHDPNAPLSPTERATLASYDQAASYYGVTKEFLAAERRADTTIDQVKASLLLVYALDDQNWLSQLRRGRHEGGPYSLRYRDAVKEHPHVRTLLVDRGGHSGLLYLADPYWFGTIVLTYLKYWQAPQAEHVTTQVPAVDLLLAGKRDKETATYRMLVRNHGTEVATAMKLSTSLPLGATVLGCWAGVEDLNPCRVEEDQIAWTIPNLSGGKSTAGPFVVTISTGALEPGRIDLSAWIGTNVPGTLVQEVTVEKK